MTIPAVLLVGPRQLGVDEMVDRPDVLEVLSGDDRWLKRDPVRLLEERDEAKQVLRSKNPIQQWRVEVDGLVRGHDDLVVDEDQSIGVDRLGSRETRLRWSGSLFRFKVRPSGADAITGCRAG